jgi:Ku protein
VERFAQLRLADHSHPFVSGGAQRAHGSPSNSSRMQNALTPAALFPACERNVKRSEVIRGYEHDDSQHVLVEDEELKKITPRSGRTMEIVAFVKEEQIDPIYFDSSYFALPEKDSERAYALLLKALEDKNRVAIANYDDAST